MEGRLREQTVEDNEGKDINRGAKREELYVQTWIWADYSDSQ